MPRDFIKMAPKKKGFPVEDMQISMTDTYINKPFLLAAYRNKELTYEQKQEYYKCRADPLYFFKTYTFILTTDGIKLNFIPYDFQLEMLEMFIGSRNSLAVTARQMGKTTTVACLILWYAIFNKNQRIAILANKEKQAKEVLTRVQQAYEDLPFFLQACCGVKVWNKLSIELENGSTIESFSTTPDSIRGKSISLLYIDEAAFVENDEEFFTSTLPVVSSGKNSKIILTSTPKGARGVFYKYYLSSVNNEEDSYDSIVVPWYKHPDRDETWEKKQRAKSDDFDQEFNCKFNSSSGTLIPSKTLQDMTFINPVEQRDKLDIFSHYKENNKYVAVADVSDGVGQDYSVLNVIDITEKPYKIAAIYRNNNISPLVFPITIASICTYYGECPVLVEANNDCGATCVLTLFESIEYDNIIFTGKDKLTQKIVPYAFKAKPGIKTTRSIKAIGSNALYNIIIKNILQVNSYDAIQELGTFIAKGDSYAADDGAHDDIVMTLILFAWLTKQDYFTEISGNDLVRDMIADGMRENQEDIIPIGIFPEGFVIDNYNL